MTRTPPLVTFVAALLLFPGCTPGADRPPPEPPPPTQVPPALVPLLGVWDLADSDPKLGECHVASIGFRSDGRYMTKSGDQVVSGRYVAEPAVVMGRRGFLVVQRAEAHNGEPNCQGVAAEVSVAAAPPDAFLAVSGNLGALYFGQPEGEPVALLVRRPVDRAPLGRAPEGAAGR